jgi:hypothetical protein
MARSYPYGPIIPLIFAIIPIFTGINAELAAVQAGPAATIEESAFL